MHMVATVVSLDIVCAWPCSGVLSLLLLKPWYRRLIASCTVEYWVSLRGMPPSVPRSNLLVNEKEKCKLHVGD